MKSTQYKCKTDEFTSKNIIDDFKMCSEMYIRFESINKTVMSEITFICSEAKVMLLHYTNLISCSNT